MKYCEQCKVYIRGNCDYCPLCQHELSGQSDERMFPVIAMPYRHNMFFIKLLILITAAAGIISFGINIILPAGGWWSAFVILGIICFWISFSLAIKKRSNIAKAITYQTVVVSLLSVFWDAITGWHGWSLDYILPILCVMTMASMAIIVKVTNIPVGDYILCMIADSIFGIAPIIFYLCNLLNVVIPSVICFCASLVSLTAIILFEGKSIKNEIVRKFHI